MNIAFQTSLFSEHVIPISGKAILATAIVQTRLHPEIDYTFIFNDTACELPEVYEWLDKVEKTLGWKIERIGEDLRAIIERESRKRESGCFLPSTQIRYCTKYAKIKPTDAYFGNKTTVRYYGIRADEERTGYIPTTSNVLPVYPLKEVGIGLREVYLMLEALGLEPPTFEWQRLKEAVISELPEDDWIPIEKWQVFRLFAWRTRANCFFCFFQRLYEWLGLKEHHPQLFEEAKAYEKSGYSWNKDHPLSDFDDSAFCEKVFNRRKNHLIKVLSGQAKEKLDSEIQGTSCGLICGK